MRVHTYAPGTIIANRYQIAVPVGAGGMGMVYYAFDHGQDGLPVALKTFHPHLLADRGGRDSFLQEGRAWLELGRHPHIVDAYAIDRVEGRGEVFIAAELISPVEGKRNASLRQWIQPGGMPWEQAFLFSLQIVWGMQHAVKVHPGLVHRDLKPENVLVGADKVAELDAQRVRVTDFGLVAGLGKADSAQIESDTGDKLIPGRSVHVAGIAGTPAYMAPEQWLGEGLDERSDIYAWGLILAELLSGKMVVAGDTSSHMKQQHLAGVMLSAPEHAPSDLRSLVEQCVSRDKLSRPEGWEALEHNLRDLWRAVRSEELPEGGWRPTEDGTAAKQRQVYAYTTIGVSYADIGQYEDSLSHFAKALKIALDIGDRTGEGRALGGLGIVNESLGQYEQALANHEQALAIAREVGDRAGEGIALGNLGVVYQCTGQYEQALTHQEIALAIAREMGDRAGEGIALGNLGNILRNLGQYEQALTHQEKALAIAREVGDRAGEGTALGNLGNIFRNTGQYEQAVACLEQSLEIARELADRMVEGSSLGNLGTVYVQTGQYEKGLAHHEQALTIARELGDWAGEGIALGNLGVVFQNTGQYEQALVHLEKALAISRELGDRAREGISLGNLGAVHLIIGQHERALAHFERELAIARELGDREGEGRALRGLGNVYLITGQYGQARPLYLEALEIASQLGDRAGEGLILVSLTMLTAETGDLPAALTHANESQHIFEQIGQPQHAEQAAYLIAEIKKLMG